MSDEPLTARAVPPGPFGRSSGDQLLVLGTAFLSLFGIVGLALYGLPFFYDFMVRDHGWTRAQVTSGNALSKFLVGPLFGFLAGWCVDRFGPRRLMLAGIAMAALALIGLGSISTLSGFYFFYLLNALGYVCGGPLPNQVLLSRWFDHGRGRAMGIAYLGIGLGGVAVPLLAVWLVSLLGWRDALRALGVLVFVMAFPLAVIVPESRPSEAAAVGPVPAIGPVLRTPEFYLLAVGSMCSIAAVGGTIQNLKLFLSLDLLHSQAEAAVVASLVLASSLIGRLVMGWLADRWPVRRVMLLIYLLVSAAIPLLFFAHVPGVIYVFAVIFGIGLGGDYMIVPLIAAEIFGVRSLGRVMGVLLTADGAAEALAPMLVARMRDVSGSYATGFATLVVFAVLGAIAVLRLPGDRALDQQPDNPITR